MSQLTCPKCGVGVLPSETVCWNCAAKLRAEEPPPEEEAKPEPAAEAARPAISPVRGSLPVWAHVTLYIVGSMAGFLGGALLGATLSMSLLRQQFAGLHIVLFFGGAIIGLHVPRLIMRHLITARCPRCQGPAVIEGRRPISYRCRNCNHLHPTKVSEGR